MIYNSPLSVWVQVNGKYQMKGEQRSQIMQTEHIPVRSGQHWEIKGGLLEVRSIKGDSVQCVRWMGQGNHQRIGAKVTAVEADIKGASSGYNVGIDELRKSTRLAITHRGLPNSRSRTKIIQDMIERRPQIATPTYPPFMKLPETLTDLAFDTMYTDGSWRKTETLRELLSGGGKIYSGGAIVLGRGGHEMTTIFIEIDVEVESAFEVELISLLIAIAMCKGNPIKIFSDCKSALSILNGKHRGSFFSLLGGWRKPESCVLEKVKAHPEKYKKPEEWSHTDRGIWAADQIAGGILLPSVKIKASEWLTHISYASKLIVVDQQGLPFVKDIANKWGKYLVDSYLVERDDYREERGKRRIWSGSNLSLLKKALGRGNSLGELAAIQRAGLDKTWRWNWARGGDECKACSIHGSNGIGHPIWRCNNPQMVACRGHGGRG